MIYKILIVLIFFASLGCSTKVKAPDVIVKDDQLKVSRELPMGNCEEIGLLRGTTISATGTQQDALDDLKMTAKNKGANYLKVEEFSETGSSSTGIAYRCY